jgi:hypothetical protein
VLLFRIASASDYHGAATVVGVGVAMEGGAEGVRLLVPDDQTDAAREILGES